MKNLKTITTAILIAVLFNTASAASFPAICATANSQQELTQAIKELVKFPEKGVAQGKSGYVLTSFKVNDNGVIEVSDMEGTTVFKSYVENQMEKISVEDPNLYRKHFQIKIYFDFQEK